MHPKVDEYLNLLPKWKTEIELLRSILLDCGLTEEFKWRTPCYTFKDSNIVLIGQFKEYCTLSFFKGSLLNDAENILVSPGENSQAVRMVKITSTEEIQKLKPVLKAYIFEAIEVEKAGLKVSFKEKEALILPEELIIKLNENPDLKTAFEALTPGRQRAYNLHFTSAKQAKTREARIEKCIQSILEGRGINDCTCGLSKRPPYCDGSHKILKK